MSPSTVVVRTRFACAVALCAAGFALVAARRSRIQARRSATALWRVRAQLRRTELAARRDPRSGMLRREAWQDLARQALCTADPARTAVAMIDLDCFKEINDTYGHAAGDEVIRAVASRLQHLDADGHIVGRFGGDEFVVLLQDIDLDQPQAQEYLNNLTAVLETPIRLTDDGCDVWVGASVGVVLLADIPVAGRGLAHAERGADVALFHAKTMRHDGILLPYHRVQGREALGDTPLTGSPHHRIRDMRFPAP